MSNDSLILYYLLVRLLFCRESQENAKPSYPLATTSSHSFRYLPTPATYGMNIRVLPGMLAPRYQLLHEGWVLTMSFSDSSLTSLLYGSFIRLHFWLCTCSLYMYHRDSP